MGSSKIDNPVGVDIHFVLVPWLAQGHMIPMIDIARLLADRGVTVSVITTPANAARIQPTIDRISASGLPLRFVPLRFPSAQVGLPEGCENADSLPSNAMMTNLCNGAKLLKDPLSRHLRDCSPPPSCVITGIAHTWTHEVTRELGLPLLVFHGYCSFSLLCVENLHLHKTHEALSMSDTFLLPGLPHRIELTRSQLPRPFHAGPGMLHGDVLIKEMRDAELAADGVVVNSFEELEPGYAQGLAKAAGKKVWSVGPVSLRNKGSKLDMAERGNTGSVDKDRCLSWLDSMEPGSVIYVSFGGMRSFGPSQLIELGSGLLASNRPFIWVLIKAAEEVEKWLSENVFARRPDAAPKCLVIRGWAPQTMILSHPAVGGFVTHCGWNSTLESISAGVPMITWPLFAEQFLNEKLVVEVIKIGVAVGSRTWTDWGKENQELDEVKVRREAVAEAVERLMDGGEEGKERRRRAKEVGEKAKKAMEEGGSSYQNMTLLIQYAVEQARKNAD